MTAAIEIVDVSKTFGGGRDLLLRRRPAVQAVRGVSLDVRAGETLGVVGESGSGKTTLARMLVGLDRPSAGAVRIDGRDSAELARGDPRALARRVQYVFQDPIAALNPRKTVRQAIEAPLRRLAGLDGAALAARRNALMSAVGLAPALADRHPHALSGGQAQRVGIARALAADAGVLVLDEPVSALDVSVQAQVLNLLARLRDEQGLTYVFISHDLAVVESLCDRIAVMYFGRIVEIAPARDLFRRPRHPYTDLLRASTPSIGKAAAPASAALAEAPDSRSPPPGCAFAPRCPRAVDRCRAETPDLDSGAGVACWRPLEPPP